MIVRPSRMGASWPGTASRFPGSPCRPSAIGATISHANSLIDRGSRSKRDISARCPRSSDAPEHTVLFAAACRGESPVPSRRGTIGSPTELADSLSSHIPNLSQRTIITR
jgi:hypothetical protein